MSTPNRSIRKRPINLIEKDIYLFQHEFEKGLPEIEVIDLKNVWVTYQGILYKGWNFLMESFRGKSNQKYERRFNQWKLIFKNRLLNRHSQVDQGIWFTDTMADSYFHWFADALPRLELVDAASCRQIYLPKKFEKHSYVNDALRVYSEFTVNFIDTQTSIHFKNIILPLPPNPSTGNFNDEIIRRIKKRLVNFPLDPNKTPNIDRIYISRAKAAKRSVVNEEEIIPILKRHGFSIHYMEEYSWLDQVGLLRNCKHLISIHGAGLTNMLFVQNGNSILELRREGDSHNNCFFSLTSALEMDYYYLNCERRLGKPGDDDIYVNGQELDELIEKFY